MYGLLSPLDLNICNGSSMYPEKSFFISNVGTGITCFPCVTLIFFAVFISSSVATSFIYIVFSIGGSSRFFAIFSTIPSDVPSIKIDSGLYFFKAFIISFFSFSSINIACFTVSILVGAFFADSPATTSFSFTRSPSSIIYDILFSPATICAL